MMFGEQVNAALDVVKKVLDRERVPQLPSEVHHEYADKFRLTEGVANCAVVSTFMCLESIGLTTETFEKMYAWAQKRTVTLDWELVSECSFLRDQVITEDDPVARVTKFAGIERVSKTTTTTHYWYWKFTATLTVKVYPGNLVAEAIPICHSSSSCQLKTLSENTPYPKLTRDCLHGVEISAVLRAISGGGADFVIDRTAPGCRTPFRNAEVKALHSLAAQLVSWGTGLHDAIRHLKAVDSDVTQAPEPPAIPPPVVPFLVGPEEEEGTVENSSEDSGSSDDTSDSGRDYNRAAEGAAERPSRAAAHSTAVAEPISATSAAVPATSTKAGNSIVAYLGAHELAGATTIVRTAAEAAAVLAEEANQLRNAAVTVRAQAKGLVDGNFAHVSVIATHLADVWNLTFEALAYVEYLMRQQLTAAIGREVTPGDVADYMLSLWRKALLPDYRPQPLAIPVRQGGNHPEGLVSIESGTTPEWAFARRFKGASSFSFPLSESVSLNLGGDVVVHALLRQQFAHSATPRLALRASARQFSGMILVVGRVLSRGRLAPKAAIVLTNRDELNMPLDVETIPSAKEFADAIVSLSPEQQAFATAFRSLQLESTLFAFAVLQIRPQLERVLELPPSALAKEIAMRESARELFQTYSVPPVVLAFDGPAATPLSQKIDAVKIAVAKVEKMIDEARAREVKEASELARVALAEQQPIPPPSRNMIPAMLPRVQMPSPVGGLKCKRLATPVPPVPTSAILAVSPRKPVPSQATSTPLRPADSASASNKTTHTGGDHLRASEGASDGASAGGYDVSKVPSAIDEQLLALGVGAAVRPQIFSPAAEWTIKRADGIIAPLVTSAAGAEVQRKETHAAFELLDALTRGGKLTYEAAEVHILIGAAHFFDLTVMDTVITQNINPIAELEATSLAIASTIYGEPVRALLEPSHVQRLRVSAPQVLAIEPRS